ncbi:hypothetical protein PG994_011707 [Apiospora phragmitis]|uniref:Uncharacterized protein n=1 Tax=Apiospora phragmitis TaxID=2905665 RepID=A0ABR1TTS1_9PEZI
MPEGVQKLAAQLQYGAAQEPRSLWRLLPLNPTAILIPATVTSVSPVATHAVDCTLPMNWGQTACSCTLPMNSGLPQCKPTIQAAPTSPKPVYTPKPIAIPSKPAYTTPPHVDCSNVANFGMSECACTIPMYSTLARCQPSTMTTIMTVVPTPAPATTPLPESTPETTPATVASSAPKHTWLI